MSTKVKENGKFARVRAFATRTMQGPRISVAGRSIKKSAVAVMSAVKIGATKVWEWAIKPALTFIQKWFGPILRGMLSAYVITSVALVTSALMTPIAAGRYTGLPLIWALIRTGFRPELAIR